MTAYLKNDLTRINAKKHQAKTNDMSQEKNKKITLNIGGMSCINCSLTIEKVTL